MGHFHTGLSWHGDDYQQHLLAFSQVISTLAILRSVMSSLKMISLQH